MKSFATLPQTEECSLLEMKTSTSTYSPPHYVDSRHTTTAVSHCQWLTLTLTRNVTPFGLSTKSFFFTSCLPPGPPWIWRTNNTSAKKRSIVSTKHSHSVESLLIIKKPSLHGLSYIYFRRYHKKHACKFCALFRIEPKYYGVLASTFFLNTRGRCKQETSAAHQRTTKQSHLLFTKQSSDKLKMSKRINHRGQSSSRGISRGASAFNGRSSTTPLTIRARKINPLPNKIYKLPIEMSLINGSEVYLYGKKADGGLQLPSSTRIGTTRFVYDDSPKRFDPNGDLLPSVGTVWSIVYRFKADQTDIIKGAIKAAKEARRTMTLPKMAGITA